MKFKAQITAELDDKTYMSETVKKLDEALAIVLLLAARQPGGKDKIARATIKALADAPVR